VRTAWIQAMASAILRADGAWPYMPPGREDWILLKEKP